MIKKLLISSILLVSCSNEKIKKENYKDIFIENKECREAGRTQSDYVVCGEDKSEIYSLDREFYTHYAEDKEENCIYICSFQDIDQ